MSEENVEIIRRAIAAFNARDKVNWGDLAAPGLELHPVPEWPENAVVHGRDAAWSFLVGNEDVWETTGYTLTETIDAEDHVFACAEQRVAGRESGVPVGELRFFCVFQVADTPSSGPISSSPATRPSKPPGCRSSAFWRSSSAPTQPVQDHSAILRARCRRRT